MIKKITDVMVEIEGEALRSVTWVRVHEVASGSWGIGGRGMTAADVKALQKRELVPGYARRAPALKPQLPPPCARGQTLEAHPTRTTPPAALPAAFKEQATKSTKVIRRAASSGHDPDAERRRVCSACAHR
jgi:4-oxalocrotonate tautomerase